MNDQPLKELDVVALTEDVPTHGLRRGQVGTIVCEMGADAFEVEFIDNEGRTYALLPLRSNQLMPLHHSPARAAS